jgi:formylglycine-generating enzyme required for sulfatase activity
LTTVRAFLIGQTEVSQALWQAVTGSNPSRFKDCGPGCPVESVSWDDAQAFIRMLNNLTGQQFRLPSEAEWEYAARAGCETEFNVGGQCRNRIEPSEGNFNANLTYNDSSRGVFRRQTLPAHAFAANTWGLYQMHGNVWEWVQDCLGPYSRAPMDGRAKDESDCTERVLRGGAWSSNPRELVSGNRGRELAYKRDGDVGFRLARSMF